MINIDIFVKNSSFIEELSLSYNNNKLELLLIIKNSNKKYCAYFYNVSRINIKDMSYPMQIGGFDLISNKEDNWDASSKYEFFDFDDDKISFYCEDFDVYDLEMHE